MKNRKALAGGALGKLILFLVGLIAILMITTQLMAESDSMSMETKCMLDNMRRATMHVDGQGSIGKSICKPIDIRIGDDKKTSSKDYIMKFLSEKAVKCWRMYGEGSFRTIDSYTSADFFASASGVGPIVKWFNSDNIYCKTCYRIQIDNIKDDKGKDVKILKGDLKGYMLKQVYKAEGKLIEVSCNDGFDNDNDGKIDCNTNNEDENCNCDDEKCKKNPSFCMPKQNLVSNPCGKNGGICRKDGCLMGEAQYDNVAWKCPDNKKCCVNEDAVYTYLSYIKYHSGAGGDVIFAGEVKDDKPVDNFELEAGRYVITYVEPGSKDYQSRLLIGKQEHLGNSCGNNPNGNNDD